MSRRRLNPKLPADGVSVVPAILECQRIYDTLIPTFCEVAELDPDVVAARAPTILTQRRGRKRATGWTEHRAWTCPERESPHDEITLCAEDLNRGALAAFQTVAHEMVHHVNGLRGVIDCSRNQYHNKAFKALAEAVGLTVEKLGHYGFAKTALGPSLHTLADDLLLDEAAFTLARIPPPAPRPGTRMKKWACACPKIFRAAVEHHAHCLDCDSDYQKVG